MPAAGVPCSNAANIGECKFFFWNIGGTLFESSVIPFLLPRHKVWLMLNFAPGKIPSGGKSPLKCIHNVPAQEMAKRRAKFGWPPMSDVAAVTKAGCGAPNS